MVNPVTSKIVRQSIKTQEPVKRSKVSQAKPGEKTSSLRKPQQSHNVQTNQASVASFSQFQEKKMSLTKIAVGVIDGANLVETSVDALKKQGRDLEDIRSLLIEANQEGLTEEKRAEVQEGVLSRLDTVDARADLVKHDGARVLSGDIKNSFVQTGGNVNEGIPIVIPQANSDDLDLTDLSAESLTEAKDSLVKVEKAIYKVSEGVDQLEKTHEDLKNVAGKIEHDLNEVINVQNDLGKFKPVELAESLDSKALGRSHSRSGGLMSQLDSLL